jgi:hypothetical protein
VRTLSSSGKLGPYLGEAGGLGIDKPLQMEWVGHGNERFALNAAIRESDKDGDD